MTSSSTPPPSTRRDGATHLFDSSHQEKHQAPPRKLRILCLHGHRTNAKVMINQTKGLRAAMGEENAEFIFLDAPFPAMGPTDPVIERVHGQDAPFYEWWYPNPVEDIAEHETKWIWSLENHAEAIAYMEQKLQEIGPVDAVVGFSQGSVLLTVLSMLSLQTRDELPWKVCVCVGGVPVGGIQFRDLMETPDGRSILVPFPSIHLIGRADPLYEESLQLVEQYDSHTTMFPTSPLKKMVVFHEEGHRFPSAHKHKELYDMIAQRIYDHCYACDNHDTQQRNHAYARL